MKKRKRGLFLFSLAYGLFLSVIIPTIAIAMIIAPAAMIILFGRDLRY